MRKRVYSFFSVYAFLCVLCLCVSNASANAQIDVAETKAAHMMQTPDLTEHVQWIQALKMNAQEELRYFGEQIKDDPVAIAAYRALRDNVELLKTGTTPIPFTIRRSDYVDSDRLIASVQKGRDAFDRDYSEVFWIDSSLGFTAKSSSDGSSVLITFQTDTNYFQAGYQTQKQVEEDIALVNQAISNIINSLSGTDYDKIKQIHDYLIEKSEYNTSSSRSEKAWEITSGLHYGSTNKNNPDNPVCEGYARAFKVLCDQLNIPCILVSGDGISGGTSEAHMWNYVKLDGAWYAVDVTWDDPLYAYTPTSEEKQENQYIYFLKGSKNFPGHINDGKFTPRGYDFSYPTLSITDYVPKPVSPTNTDAEKVTAAKQAVEKVLQNFNATNQTTQPELKSAIEQAASNTGVTATISAFHKKDATSSAAGAVTGTITLLSGNTTGTVFVNIPIAKLSATDVEKVAAAKQAVEKNLQNFTATNQTTESDLKTAVNQALGSTGVTATLGNFYKTDATSSTAGAVTGTITLHSGNENTAITFNLPIVKLSVADAEKITAAKQAVEKALQSFLATNQTTDSDVKTVVNQALGNTGVTATLSNFHKTNAVSNTAGAVTGTVTLRSGNTTETVSVNIPIAKLNLTDTEKIEAVKQSVIHAIQGFTATNSTTVTDLTNIARGALGNTGVTATIADFQKTDATSSAAGAVTGMLTLQSGNTTYTVSVNVPIAKLNVANAEKIAAVKQNVIHVLRGTAVTNQTTEADLIRVLNQGVLKNTGITATVNGFRKINATEQAAGSITGSIELQSGNTRDSFTLSLTIPALPSNSGNAAKQENVQIIPSIDTGKNAVTATITESHITNAIQKVIKDGKVVKESTITLDIKTKNTVQSVRTRLPLTIQNSLVSHSVQGTAIRTEAVQITLDLNTVQFIREQFQTDVDIDMKTVNPQRMSTTLKNAVSGRPFYDFGITAVGSNQSIHTFGTGKLWISIPYTPQRVDKNGKPNAKGTLEKLSEIKGTYISDTGAVSFVKESYYDAAQKAVMIPTNHLSVYGVGYALAKDEPEIQSAPVFSVAHTISVGSSYQLQFTQLKDAVRTVKSSNPSVASVTKAGLIKGKKSGTATITYTIEQNQTMFTYKVKLIVKKNGKKVYQLKASALQAVPSSKYPVLHSYREVSSKKKIKFGLSSLPKEAKVTYKSSHSQIASVNSKGIITGKKAGIAVVTAAVKLDGETYYYKAYVKVSDGKTKISTSKYLK